MVLELDLYIQAIKTSTEHVCSKLSGSNTKYKRLKRLKLDSFYVAPEAKAIGTRFECRRANVKEIALPIRLYLSIHFHFEDNTMFGKQQRVAANLLRL